MKRSAEGEAEWRSEAQEKEGERIAKDPRKGRGAGQATKGTQELMHRARAQPTPNHD